MSELKLTINIEVLLNILLDTTRAYMEAFEIPSSSIDLGCNLIEKYQAFDQISALYLDSSDKVIAFVSFKFDWESYKINVDSDDPDVLVNRKSIVGMTPKKILHDACEVIQKRVTEIKNERGYCGVKLLYYYSAKVRNDKELLQKIRTEAHLTPFDVRTLKYSQQLEGYQTSIESSTAEGVLSMDFVT